MNIYETILELQKEGRESVLITVVNKEGHGPQVPGAKLLVCIDGKKVGTIGGGALENVAINEAALIFKNKKNVIKSYNLGEDNKIVNSIETGMICGGSISLFYEYIGSKENVIVFGAGHVGKALAHYLKPLGFNATLYDCRKDILNELNGTNKQLIDNYNNIAFDKMPIDDSYIVITTHSHELDYTILKGIYQSKSKPKYVGMISSKKKSEKMLERLSSEIKENIDLSNLYTPIGLKIGGTTPAEIALSIAAELQVIKYAQDGNKHARRDRK